jgi:hypothetical protein
MIIIALQISTSLSVRDMTNDLGYDHNLFPKR